MSTPWLAAFSFLALSFGLTNCASFQGEYSDPNTVEIVDDRWNESDARKTAETLISSMLSKPWLTEFNKSHSKKPIVLVSDVENRTTEHIDTKAMLEAIRYELINSGAIRFVDGAGRDNLLKEMKYQNESGMVSSEMIKKKGKQLGADYILTGALSSQEHTQGGLKTVTYQTVMQLTDLETAEIVWTQKFDIKKRFKRSSAGW